MAVKSIAPISDHYTEARDRNHQFNKDVTKTHTVSWSATPVSGWEVMIHAFTSPAQGLEDVMNDMLNNRGLANAEGVNLDRIGEIVGATRGGSTDSGFVDIILAQIAANNSNTTARDLMTIATILIGDDLRQLLIKEVFPAKAIIDYLAELQFAVTSANNAFSVQHVVPFASYVFPADGAVTPTERVDQLKDGNFISLIFTVEDNTAGTDFYDELSLQYKNGSYIELVDQSGVDTWRFTNTFGANVIGLGTDGGALIIEVFLTNFVGQLNPGQTITRNGISQTPSQFNAFFVAYDNLDEATWDTNNPNGLLGLLLVPVVLPDGDFFPHELKDLASDLIEAAWGEPIVVDFTGAREFQFNIDTVPVLVEPAINWGTAGPLYGFTDGQTISATTSGDPIPGPDFSVQALADVLDSAKAAGVGIDAEAVSLGNYFGFSNDSESLGFGALVGAIVIGGGTYSTLI